MIIKSSNKDFKNYWSKLYNKCYKISPFYSKVCQEYYAQRPIDEGRSLKDVSFLLLWEDYPVIAFRGAEVTSKGKTDLIFYEVPSTSIEDKEKLTAKAAKVFLKEFDGILDGINGSVYFRDFLLTFTLNN